MKIVWTIFYFEKQGRYSEFFVTIREILFFMENIAKILEWRDHDGRWKNAIIRVATYGKS